MTNIMVLDFEGSFEQHIASVSRFKVSYVKSTFEMAERCQDDTYSAAIIDFDHPLAHFDAIDKIIANAPRIKILGMSTDIELNSIVSAVRAGLYHYLLKPASTADMKVFLDSIEAPESRPQEDKHGEEGVQLRDGRTIIGRSAPIQEVFALIKRLAKVDTTVLVCGESGTGKELIAQALHNYSSRRDGPFVAVNCGAIPENLIESELFGYEKGAFTGAEKRQIGKFQLANKGTIFLDEVGDVSPMMQVKLLRALQEKKISPVGSHEEIPIDVRVISATNKALEQMVEEESFRADLYYRLHVMPINLPPLRARGDDIEDLCDFMIRKFNRLHNRQISAISEEAMTCLKQYNWPGNVRELENVIEHAFIIENGTIIEKHALPSHISPNLSSQQPENLNTASNNGFSLLSNDLSDLKYPNLKEQFEKEFIKTALKTYQGRINVTAEQTQMTKVTLLRKLEKYDINPKDFQH